MELDLLIRDGRLCREDGPPVRGSLGVRDGRIVVVAASAAGLDASLFTNPFNITGHPALSVPCGVKDLMTAASPRQEVARGV